jgi:hypothetical protein
LWDNKAVKQVLEFEYLGYLISDHRRDMKIKLQFYNKINGIGITRIGSQWNNIRELITLQILLVTLKIMEINCYSIYRKWRQTEHHSRH